MSSSNGSNADKNHEPRAHDVEYTRYILWFVYACIIYSMIGFSWGALMGGIAEFRYFVDHRMHGDLIVRAHTHINLLGWVEMAIFAAVYYIVPRLVKRPIYSLKLVKVHFWVHNFGLIGMVVFFTTAGVLGGLTSETGTPEQVEAVVTAIDDKKQQLTANGYLSVDGKIIYQMKDFTINLH